MSRDDKISRRNFLITVLAASGVSFFAGTFWHSRQVKEVVEKLDNPVTSDRLGKILSEIGESAKVIGKEYINSYPSGVEVSRSQLLSKLNNKLGDQELTVDIFYEVKERLKRQIMVDFENSEFVEIRNWLVTKTEARICAIIYLSN